MSIRVTYEGIDDVHRMLSAYSDPRLTERLKAATKDGAKVFVKPLKSEARPVSRRMANSVKVLTNKRDKPGYHVKFKPTGNQYTTPYFKHMVIGGTSSHGPRTSAPALVFVPGWNPYMGRAPRARRAGNAWVRAARVKGVRPNPMVTRVADRYEQQAYAAFDKSLDSTEAR